MKKALRITSLLLILVLILNISGGLNIQAIQILQQKNVIVEINGKCDYTSIQEAIDNACEGETILIKSGFYNETINIKKRITLLGEDKNKTIINPISARNKYAIRLGSPNIIIKNLSISNGGPGLYTTGIKITASNVKIEDCNIYDTPVGIAIFTSGNIIKNCRFWGCKDEGIALIGSNYSECIENEITNCIFHNNCDGIELQYSSDNIISNCEFFDNTHTGIDAISSSNDRNKIINCNIYNNSVNGIYLHSSSGNQITDCMFSNNKDGDIVEVKCSIKNKIVNTNDEREVNSIKEMLVYLLNFFQKRFTKARIFINSIFNKYKDLCF